MARARVPLHQRPGYVDVDTGATDGAVIGGNLRLPDGSVPTAEMILNPPVAPEARYPITLWRRILEIPGNIKKLAALAGVGFATRSADGNWHQRQITTSPRLLVEHGDGAEGDPFLDIADSLLTAAGALSALRVVVGEGGAARYPDVDVIDDALRAAGVTVSAADDGDLVRVRTDGELIDASWAWAPGVIWCGAAGVLTQAPPATGWLLEVGRAIAPDRVVIDLQTPYIRSV